MNPTGTVAIDPDGQAVLESGPSAEVQKNAAPVRPKVLVVTLRGDPSGGGAYETMVAECLASRCEVVRHELSFGQASVLGCLKAPLGLARMLAAQVHSRDCAVVIKTFDAAALNVGGPARAIVMLHHLGSRQKGLYSQIERHIFHRLRRVNAVVTVSEYWRRRLRAEGLTKVWKVYNGFRLEEFAIPSAAVESFKRRYGLTGKPIVYLGSHQEKKGVDESFAALQDLDVHFVASSSVRRHPSIKCLCLNRPEYLCLLRAATVVVTMSQFDEGWCRIAHEAMLSGTPAVGSGRGGMRELLESGGQIVCQDFRSLRSAVENLLCHEERRAELGRAGYDYAKQFTYERFERAWTRLVDEVGRRPSDNSLTRRNPQQGLISN
ncbi:MAG TPA: glycosyltransferase family 4 protein [Terriglobia bacterium]|nr:glycosyltransferase family 4 protein [Terriglobia bacterium]